MADLERMAKNIGEKVITQNNILPLLKVCASNISLSYLNQLLLFDRKPEAGPVCGRKAWEYIGRSVKKGAVPITLLVPRFIKVDCADDFNKTEYKADYVAANVFELSDTEGEEYQKERPNNVFPDRITQITGITWEVVGSEALKDSLEFGMYDRERQVFCLLQSATEEQKERTVISLYIDYVMDLFRIHDITYKLAVSYVVYERLGIKHMIVKALFGKLEKLEIEEKLEFLRSVLWIAKRVLDDLTGNVLSFDETSFINSLLVSDDRDVVYLQMQEVAASLDNSDLREELDYLSLRLRNSKDGYLSWLLEQKDQKALFSFPPAKLYLNETDYYMERGAQYDE